jgi:hypothetical protein
MPCDVSIYFLTDLMHFTMQTTKRLCDDIVIFPVLTPERLYECDDDAEATRDESDDHRCAHSDSG